MDLFGQSCAKIFLDQIETRDILDFRGFLKRPGFADRTVFNYFEAVNSFLRAYGIKDMVPKREWPRFDEKPIKKYGAEELAKLFKAADEGEWLLFQFLLGSGGCEEEVARLKWPISIPTTRTSCSFRSKAPAQTTASPAPSIA